MVTNALIADVAILEKRCQVYETLMRQAEESIRDKLITNPCKEKPDEPPCPGCEIDRALVQAIRKHLEER